MAEKYNMKLQFTKTFHDFFREKTKESTSLLYKMKALEVLNAEFFYTCGKFPVLQMCLF